MWSKYKPPILNWILLKFYKYENICYKILTFKFSKFSIVKTLIYSQCSIYLIITKLFFLKNFFVFFKNNFSFFFNINYFSFFLFSFSTFEKFKNINFFMFFNFFNILNIKHLANRNISEIGLHQTYFLTFEKENFFTLIFLKDILFKKIFFKNILKIFSFFNIFFFNIFFIFFLLNVYWVKSNISLLKWKVFFYNEINIWINFFYNPFEKKFILVNWCLTIQRGLAKWTRFYISKYNLTTSSTQIIWPWTVLLFWFFFKNLIYLKINWTYLFEDLNLSENSEILIKTGIYLWNWHLTIIPSCIGKLFYIHTGDRFTPLWIIPTMVGHKFGEFSLSWKIRIKK